jgi:hypothetical protein
MNEVIALYSRLGGLMEILMKPFAGDAVTDALDGDARSSMMNSYSLADAPLLLLLVVLAVVVRSSFETAMGNSPAIGRLDLMFDCHCS